MIKTLQTEQYKTEDHHLYIDITIVSKANKEKKQKTQILLLQYLFQNISAIYTEQHNSFNGWRKDPQTLALKVGFECCLIHNNDVDYNISYDYPS